jgi:hypothetical protein
MRRLSRDVMLLSSRFMPALPTITATNEVAVDVQRNVNLKAKDINVAIDFNPPQPPDEQETFFRDQNLLVQSNKSRGCRLQMPKVLISPDRASTSTCEQISQMRNLDSQRNPKGYSGNTVSRKTVLQTSYTQTLPLWFLTTTVITTTQESLTYSDGDNDATQKISTTRTILDIRSHPCIVKFGLFTAFESTSLRCGAPNLDLSLRAYKFASWDAPIVKTCRRGDIAAAHDLFTRGLATPYDIVMRNSSCSSISSLTDLAWEYWLALSFRISESKAFDNIKPLLRKLGRLFEMFVFLADNGRIPSASIRLQDELVPRLWVLLDRKWPTHLALTPHLEDMTRFVISKATEYPGKVSFQRDREHFRAHLELLPEFMAWRATPSASSTRKPPSLHKINTSLGTTHLRIFRSYGASANSLILDPEASYVRQFLLHVPPKTRSCSLAGICIMGARQSCALFREGKGCWDSNVKARLIACLNYGMDPLEKPLSEASNNSLVQIYILNGKQELLRSALLEVGRDPEEITTIFEEEACGLIVRELDQIRPARHFSEETGHIADIHCLQLARRCCRYYMDLLLDERYRTYFPDSEAEILEALDHADGCNYDNCPLSGTNQPFSFPTINGLTEDFWN